MAVPGSLRVNGRQVRLLPVPAAKMPDAYGQWHEGSTRIKYRTRMANDLRRDTLLHEVMHCILSLQGREYGEAVEEDYVRALATGLIGVFNDNPEFANWIIKE